MYVLHIQYVNNNLFSVHCASISILQPITLMQMWNSYGFIPFGPWFTWFLWQPSAITLDLISTHYSLFSLWFLVSAQKLADWTFLQQKLWLKKKKTTKIEFSSKMVKNKRAKFIFRYINSGNESNGVWAVLKSRNKAWHRYKTPLISL